MQGKILSSQNDNLLSSSDCTFTDTVKSIYLLSLVCLDSAYVKDYWVIYGYPLCIKVVSKSGYSHIIAAFSSPAMTQPSGHLRMEIYHSKHEFGCLILLCVIHDELYTCCTNLTCNLAVTFYGKDCMVHADDCICTSNIDAWFAIRVINFTQTVKPTCYIQ